MKVAVIVPAYNEEENIGRVLPVVLAAPGIDEVIVVSDGSRDRTAAIARSMGCRVVELACNLGKGGAMMAGARATEAEVLLFLDADLIGLQVSHVRALLEPVVSGQADMTVGVFTDGRLATDLAQKLAPFLSGQRALRRKLLEDIPDLDRTGFGVEVAISRYAERARLRVVKVPLDGVAQRIKEEKAGLWRGFRARMRMYWEILKTVR